MHRVIRTNPGAAVYARLRAAGSPMPEEGHRRASGGDRHTTSIENRTDRTRPAPCRCSTYHENKPALNVPHNPTSAVDPDPHRVPSGKQQTRQRADTQAHEEQNDEIDHKTHTAHPSCAPPGRAAGLTLRGPEMATPERGPPANVPVIRQAGLVRAHRRCPNADPRTPRRGHADPRKSYASR